MDYTELANRVLSMLKTEHGDDPSNGHLTMDNWEWPTGVALYGVYKTYQQSGDRAILDYLTAWYDRRLQMEPPHRNVNTVAPVLALTCLYDETRNPAYLPVIESWAEWVLRDMPRTELGGLSALHGVEQALPAALVRHADDGVPVSGQGGRRAEPAGMD